MGFLFLHAMVSCYLLVDRISTIGEVMLYFACMLLSVLIFGGGSIHLRSHTLTHRREPDSKKKIKQLGLMFKLLKLYLDGLPSPIISCFRRFT
ncbi:hypothetical protein MPTK1_1g17460 [Marchantia polymorpha subsp. ruderalis]|uniref:Uncharacterized protein n=2 Tax=Marchantia polymorpha TaxID=3197 RepID=A0AAF6AR79_MARPO|nr:hypothetical protein MARPO_0001s0086 [Marchantia polymorpha]BBM98949.1 hypothetical protein Mp_1g17460 [Marchantia polymorpha subsp. ruderalis]|eukprot:PTQ50026.1 hypothetical protein MARPO_0001s0086 [Marchantia polymorpha]